MPGQDTSAETSGGESPEALFVMIRARAREEKVEPAGRMLTTIAAPTRANPDCLEFRLLHDKDDPQLYVMLERWTGMDAVLAHGKRDYMVDFNAAKDELFESIDGDFVDELRPPDGES